MGKRKNHTGNNHTYRCHRNGIKKMPNFRFQSTKGVSRTHASPAAVSRLRLHDSGYASCIVAAE